MGRKRSPQNTLCSFGAGIFFGLSALFCLLSPSARAGEPLSAAHAALDRDDQCGSCHVSFEGAPASKCMDCHKDIERRVQAGRGFHGRLRGSIDCRNCHREHRGRDYDIRGLNIETFDHNLTGWPLSGRHGQVDCRQCHTAQRPSGRESYLGASPRCVDCHGRYHGEGVRADLDRCEGCHNAFAWDRLNGRMSFNHQKETRFPLSGLHQEVECRGCHKDPARFGPMEIQGCVSCHEDPHPPGIFGALRCEDCHQTSGFDQLQSFRHQITGWPLRGAHKRAKCESCHSWERWRPPSSDCSSCHEDQHDGQFGRTPCERCHQESSFRDLRFNHDTMSRFPLRGRHRQVDCASCHPQGRYRPLERECRSCHSDENPHGETFGEAPCSQCHKPTSWRDTQFDHAFTGFPLEARHSEQPCYRCHPQGTEVEDDTQSACIFCHQDQHRGQFPERDCLECHEGSESWSIELFDHGGSRFPLEGRHSDHACDDCHQEGHFKPIDTRCANCHQNFHEGQFAKPCEECHVPQGWEQVNFDHQRQSSYPLEGLHQEQSCGKCHIQNRYKGLPTQCEGCHLDIHEGERGPECVRCHSVSSWKGNQQIDHDFGAIRLGGAHDLLACERCHGPDRQETLAGTGPECVRCHRDPHFGSFGPLCSDCHNQQAFLPSTFLHARTGFRLTGSHRFVNCRECHPNRVFGGLPTDCQFCHLDNFQATSGGGCDHPAQCPEGLGNCADCHRTDSFLRARPGARCGECRSGGRR
ncbi:MAG: hypothetical protein VYD19_09235 [Myxococcota bacterium]|nr:hypothetical protein [Myxococcota bacterium]